MTANDTTTESIATVTPITESAEDREARQQAKAVRDADAEAKKAEEAAVTETATKRRGSRASRAAAKNDATPPAADKPAEGTPVDEVATPTEQVVPPKAARTPAPRVERATTEHGAPPAGYLVLKATPSFDQFRKADATAEGPDWLTRCNAHGETTSADNRKAGRTLGSAAARASWCSGCKADARKAKAEAAKAERAAAKNTPATADASADATADAAKADAAADATAEHDAAAKSE
jgi:colicin import membrane protein